MGAMTEAASREMATLMEAESAMVQKPEAYVVVVEQPTTET
jgi:hypothetical protein